LVIDSGKAENVSGDQSLEDIEHSLEVARLNRALRNLHIEPLGATSNPWLYNCENYRSQESKDAYPGKGDRYSEHGDNQT